MDAITDGHSGNVRMIDGTSVRVHHSPVEAYWSANQFTTGFADMCPPHSEGRTGPHDGRPASFHNRCIATLIFGYIGTDRGRLPLVMVRRRSSLSPIFLPEPITIDPSNPAISQALSPAGLNNCPHAGRQHTNRFARSSFLVRKPTIWTSRSSRGFAAEAQIGHLVPGYFAGLSALN